eukprot:5700466-Amphidinium_carterae.2
MLSRRGSATPTHALGPFGCEPSGSSGSSFRGPCEQSKRTHKNTFKETKCSNSSGNVCKRDFIDKAFVTKDPNTAIERATTFTNTDLNQSRYKTYSSCDMIVPGG